MKYENQLIFITLHYSFASIMGERNHHVTLPAAETMPKERIKILYTYFIIWWHLASTVTVRS